MQNVHKFQRYSFSITLATSPPQRVQTPLPSRRWQRDSVSQTSPCASGRSVAAVSGRGAWGSFFIVGVAGSAAIVFILVLLNQANTIFGTG